MLEFQFIAQNLHFAVSFFAALVFCAAFWLYFDAWINRREAKELLKWLGFFLLFLSFLAHAILIEREVLASSRFGDVIEPLAWITHLAGYFFIICGLIIDPLQPQPQTEGVQPSLPENSKPSAEPKPSEHHKKKPKKITIPAFFPLPSGVAGLGSLKLGLPLAGFIIGGLYLRRSIKGLERHLRPVAMAFFFLAVSDALSLATLLRGTDDPVIYGLVASFGWIWRLEHLFLLVGTVLLGRWVWQYLTKRVLSQLFMIFVAATTVIFLVAAISLTFLLMSGLQRESLNNLETAANTLNYAVESKKAETQANAETIAQDPAIATVVASQDHDRLASLTNSFLQTKKQSSLVIVNDVAKVLLRGEDPSRWGDSLSDNTLIRRALIGTTASDIGSQEGVVAPSVRITTAVPIRDESSNIVGAVLVGLVLGNDFVDGIKQTTGLDSAIYSGNTRSATTFAAADGQSRLIGVKETNKSVLKQVLEKGRVFKGSINSSGRSYLAVYAPLKDVDNETTGMLFTGLPQLSLLQNANRSIELVFLTAAALLLTAIWPAYLVARHIERQLS